MTWSTLSTLPGYTWSNKVVDVFEERLTPSWWLIVALFLAVPTSVLIFFPLSIAVGLIVGLGIWLAAVAALWVGSPRLRLDRAGFSAGRARVELQHISAIDQVPSEQARDAKGPSLDARAYLVIRPWITPAVRVHIDDPRDPTPYWLVSTRKPQLIVEAWQRMRPKA